MGVGSPKNGPVNIFSDPFGLYAKLVRQGRTSGDDEQVLPRLSTHILHRIGCYNRLIMWNRCLEATGKSFGGKDYQSSNNLPSQQQQQQQQQQSECDDDGDQGCFNSWMETIKKGGHDDQQQQFDDEKEEDDQDWIENLESTLEVDDEEQQPLQQLPLIHQPLFEQHQPQVLQQHTDDNIINVEDYDDIPPCIFLDEYQDNFNSWMETIKKRGHDDQQKQVDEEEEPSPKRAKARVAN
ncbi:hypothetical protein Syun_019747 [Stephania yunnanensis]|uniref:Uncharacterized protein n=1 Tax=Stephania yunnanensis TaxID=152371 RepID=A0AAP0IVV4_9MAGN